MSKQKGDDLAKDLEETVDKGDFIDFDREGKSVNSYSYDRRVATKQPMTPEEWAWKQAFNHFDREVDEEIITTVRAHGGFHDVSRDIEVEEKRRPSKLNGFLPPETKTYHFRDSWYIGDDRRDDLEARGRKAATDYEKRFRGIVQRTRSSYPSFKVDPLRCTYGEKGWFVLHMGFPVPG